MAMMGYTDYHIPMQTNAEQVFAFLIIKSENFIFRDLSCKADHTTELAISYCKVKGVISWERKLSLEEYLSIF